jgi:uncharacterized protein YbjT (DUF2867 family)
MIVAVTGASGFVGSNLIRELLAQGHTVRALAHTIEPPPSDEVSLAAAVVPSR